MAREIRITGAREHNLQGIDLAIPRDKFVVITGISGSGKSSLAFDTIYAEGQRKYVESLSAYARQFLEQMQKPDVEHIEGLPPTIAIEQRRAGANPRSTVATITEVYDYLRLLFARVGQPHCWKCGKPIAAQTVTQMVDHLLAQPEGSRLMILAPVIRGQKGEHKEILAGITRQGFVRARIDGEIVEVKDAPGLHRHKQHTIEAVVDRLAIRTEARTRLTDSLEVALKFSEGLAVALIEKDMQWHEQLYSEHYACPEHPEATLEGLAPRMFSFNSPYGACKVCDGLGTRLEFDEDLIIPDKDKSLSGGAIDAFRHSGKRMNIQYARLLRQFCAAFDISPDQPFRTLPKKVRHTLLYGTPAPKGRTKRSRKGPQWEGVIPNLQRRWKTTDSEFVKSRLHSFLSEHSCKACNGARLRPESLSVTLGDKAISDIARMSVSSARAFFADIELDEERSRIAAQVLKEIRSRLGFMEDVGVGYLTLDRTAATLAGGEAQRIRLATQVGSGLVGCCYVLDEPTIGLHSRDTGKLLTTLRRLTDIGNTVLVVEHDEQAIRAADHLIDVGPGAGARGGRIVAQGELGDILGCKGSLTGMYLSGRTRIETPEKHRKVNKGHCLQLHGASENNLDGISVRFPLGVFCCVTGVSGSGKSTLVTQTLLRALRRRLYGTGDRPGAFNRLLGVGRIDKVIEIDQSPIGRTPRSNPGTYTGVFDQIRAVFSQTRSSRIRGYRPGRFSFNVRGGRCEACQGQGTKCIEMHFLPDVYVTCSECKGRRYNRQTLEVRYKGKNIADVLDMTVAEALTFFDNFPKIKQLLRTLHDVGLGYIHLGQPSTTLSGGEAQRVKLSTELGKTATGRTLYVLDEPTTGLHFADIQNLLNVLNRLAEKGNSILVIEHNLDVIKSADWIIDLGPEGGDGGGRVVAEGTPGDLSKCGKGHTAACLRGFRV